MENSYLPQTGFQITLLNEMKIDRNPSMVVLYKISHFLLIRQQIWPPMEIFVADTCSSRFSSKPAITQRQTKRKILPLLNGENKTILT